MSAQPTSASPQKTALKFNVAQQLKEPGSSLPRIYQIDDALIPDLDNDIVLLTPLQGRLKFTKTDTDILVTGTLSSNVELACTRCLTPVRISLTLEIEETFSPTFDIISGRKIEYSDDIDETNLISPQHILDLTEVVKQELALSEPTQVLCKEDCLGLCDQCGQNKNMGQCNCPNDNIDIRWAGLLALKDD